MSTVNTAAPVKPAKPVKVSDGGAVAERRTGVPAAPDAVAFPAPAAPVDSLKLSTTAPAEPKFRDPAPPAGEGKQFLAKSAIVVGGIVQVGAFSVIGAVLSGGMPNPVITLAAGAAVMVASLALGGWGVRVIDEKPTENFAWAMLKSAGYTALGVLGIAAVCTVVLPIIALIAYGGSGGK